MTYCASHSKAKDVSIALDAICDELATGLKGVPPDISFLFVSHYHADRFEQLASLVTDRLHLGTVCVLVRRCSSTSATR